MTEVPRSSVVVRALPTETDVTVTALPQDGLAPAAGWVEETGLPWYDETGAYWENA